MFSHIWTEDERTAKIKKEQKRLNKIFTNIEEDKKQTVAGLIKNASFQIVMLEEVSLIIKRDGYVDEYQNGENQKGLKKSAAVEVYDKALNTYSKIIKQLCDLLPNASDSQPGAELMNFISKGK